MSPKLQVSLCNPWMWKCITNFMGHNLVIIVVWNFLFIGSYKINIDVIHLYVLFEHWCCVHCLKMNVICLFILFNHRCCMSIRVVYTKKLCTWLLCLNNAQYSCLHNMNLWNNRFHTDLEQNLWWCVIIFDICESIFFTHLKIVDLCSIMMIYLL